MKFFTTFTAFLCMFFFLGGTMEACEAESVPAFFSAPSMPLSRKVVIIDAGHGASDPGKVAGKVLEKEINLSIALKLQTLLEAGDATVIMTRIDDGSLSTSKSGDMHKRKEIANASQADIFVSIHQNSFHRPNVHGTQVFYYNTSDNSRRLAEQVQRQLTEFANPGNKLESRANENYYVLRQTAMPAILVECGFLTNPSERSRLTGEKYQERIAWAIYTGIVDYFDALERTE